MVSIPKSVKEFNKFIDSQRKSSYENAPLPFPVWGVISSASVLDGMREIGVRLIMNIYSYRGRALIGSREYGLDPFLHMECLNRGVPLFTVKVPGEDSFGGHPTAIKLKCPNFYPMEQFVVDKSLRLYFLWDGKDHLKEMFDKVEKKAALWDFSTLQRYVLTGETLIKSPFSIPIE